MINALPFAISFLTLPLLWLGATNGGWWIALVPLYGWYSLAVIDLIVGKNEANPDIDESESSLFWFKIVTRTWFPLQFFAQFATLAYVSTATHLDSGEKIALFTGVGVMSGSIGIVFAHELIHQKSRLDRWLGDLLLASVLYSHFRSEHLLVHHVYVGTEKDAVSARYNEGFWRFFARVLPASLRSAWQAEGNRQIKNGNRRMSPSNPFWRYSLLQLFFLALALLIAGPVGVALFAWQALIAVFQLELINYIEHYGLTRHSDASGKVEPVAPHHSWNATQRVSNLYLINLQRHADHHMAPARPYPLLQTFDRNTAPELPASYPIMTLMAVVPPLFRRVMNPRVRAWRKRHYPEIADWKAKKSPA